MGKCQDNYHKTVRYKLYFVDCLQGFGNKSITLYDIRAELNHRYKDLRQPFQAPNSSDLFYMLTHETPESFYVGKMVQATVTGIIKQKTCITVVLKYNVYYLKFFVLGFVKNLQWLPVTTLM